MKITSALFIPDDELRFTFVQASGPGGQNVNKLSTAVQLRFDVNNSDSLNNDVKQRLKKLAGSRMTREGELVIEAKRHRSQEINRADALARLAVLVEKASQTPKTRQSTKPSLAAQNKRLEIKRKRGAIKQQRRSFED